MSGSHLEVKGQNEYRLIELYLVWPSSQPYLIGFPWNMERTFTMMRQRVALKTLACTSNVKVKLTRSKWVLFDRTVSCLACISTMHHSIPKLLGTHVHHHKVSCTRPRPVPQMARSQLEVKSQNENCLIRLYLVRHATQQCIIGIPSY